MIYLYLALGGVLGTLARHALGGWVHSLAGTTMPWGTLAVNLLGSLLFGFLMRFAEAAPMAPEMRALLTVGFCGAFTTFSTLSFETLALLQTGERLRAALYAFGSLGLGLAAVVSGFVLAGALARAGG
ncbi:MAG TPA: fluoride efflux transporter CrcB [Longimicrobiaceae bacterium]|nr:fluoride efflux transporter CrcB [Longimicrobiaceae bacterium]